MAEPDAKDPSAEPEASGDAAERELRCDFCGEPTPSVRRVALDRDYERLQTRHKPLYACVPCSEKKERQRLGLERG